MSENITKCPVCGSAVEHDVEPSFQEYVGAKVWPAYESWECTKCEWTKSAEGECIEGQENKRGYVDDCPDEWDDDDQAEDLAREEAFVTMCEERGIMQ